MEYSIYILSLYYSIGNLEDGSDVSQQWDLKKVNLGQSSRLEFRSNYVYHIYSTITVSEPMTNLQPTFSLLYSLLWPWKRTYSRMEFDSYVLDLGFHPPRLALLSALKYTLTELRMSKVKQLFYLSPLHSSQMYKAEYKAEI